MADLPIITSEFEKAAKVVNTSVNELVNRISTLTTTIKETFPAIDKSGVYSNKLADALNKTTVSTKEFVDEMYKLGKASKDIINKVKGARTELIDTIDSVTQVQEKRVAQWKSVLEEIQNNIDYLLSAIPSEISRQGKSIASLEPIYADFIESLKELKTATSSILAGTIPTDISKAVTSFQDLSQAVNLLASNSKNLIVVGKKQIGMIESLYKRVQKIADRSKTLINISKTYDILIQEVKDSLKSYLLSVEPLTKHNEVLRKQYDMLSTKIEEIGTKVPFTAEAISEIVKNIDSLKAIIEETSELIKEYSKSTAKFIVWQHMANDAFKRFSEKMAQLPKPIQTIVTSIGKFVLNMTTFVRSIVAGAGSVVDAIKSLREFVKTILEVKNVSMTFAGIVTTIITIFYALYEAGMRVTRLTAETVKSFGEYVFGLQDVSQFTYKLINSWSSLIYSTETVIKTVSDVMNVFTPLGETFESITKRGASSIISFSMTIDRFARSIGTTANELSGRLVKFASYFGYNLETIIKQGRKGALDILQMYSNFAGYILRRIRLTMTEVTQTFSSVFERIMWMGSQFSSINSQLMARVVSAIAATGKTFSLTVEHSRKLAEQFAEVISGVTWDTYAGILAATGRWTKSLDDMVYKSLVTTPFEKARETAQFFMNIAKYNAGLEKTWLAFVPQFREIIRRFPEETDVLRNAVETWVQNRNIDFKEALSKSGLSVDKIDEIMLVMDAFGNPLQTLITLVKRILDKLTLIVGRLSSSWLMSIASRAPLSK